jgi:hypothetical protein
LPEDQFELVRFYKINALRSATAGIEKEYFDIWEADRDITDAAKSHEELLTKGCFSSGSLGHWAREFPHPKGQGKGENGKGTGF